MALFYRVLDNAVDTGRPPEQSTKRRWDRHEYNSTHVACPKEWDAAYKGDGRKPEDFDVKCEWGIHTPAAIAAFLAAKHDYEELPADSWPWEVLVAVGELDGTCAFTNPESAW